MDDTQKATSVTDRESIWAREDMQTAARWLGAVLFVVASWFYAASGLIAPIWAVAVLWLLWLGLLITLIRAWRPKPWRVLAVSLVAYLIWAGVMLVGEFGLGWSP